MNMRERLARAVELKLLEFEQWELTPSEALEISDAVLDELMMPTEGMMESEDALSLAIFTAMIKAAKEGK